MRGQKAPVRGVRIRRWRGGASERVRDALAVEEPLEMRLAWREPDAGARSEPIAVTMRTPGSDFELVAGFLHGEGLLPARDALQELTYCRGERPGEQAFNVVEARLRPGLVVDLERLRRNVYTTSSCGVCGKASLEAVEAQGCTHLGADELRVEPELLPELPGRLRDDQDVFQRTGGLHAAGLFDDAGTLLHADEDVGRHNAVDKVVGHLFLEDQLPAAGRILVVSGRASFELVQKAVAAGIPMLVAVGAPSSLAVELAERFGMTLVGFARDGGFNLYAAPDRVR